MMTTMHDDQLHIDTDIAVELIGRQFPQYRDERIEPLRTIGTDNAIFRVGSTLAARFPLRAMDPAECAEVLRNEAAAMTEFAQQAPFATPRPVGLGKPGPRYPLPWSIQSWIEGEVATPTGFAASTVLARD